MLFEQAQRTRMRRSDILKVQICEQKQVMSTSDTLSNLVQQASVMASCNVRCVASKAVHPSSFPPVQVPCGLDGG